MLQDFQPMTHIYTHTLTDIKQCFGKVVKANAVITVHNSKKKNEWKVNNRDFSVPIIDLMLN